MMDLGSAICKPNNPECNLCPIKKFCHSYKNNLTNLIPIKKQRKPIDIDEVEVGEGESLEDIKAKLKPKKSTISADMLDTANTYDDKVAVIRMIVGDEAGKVSNVFRQLMKKDV